MKVAKLTLGLMALTMVAEPVLAATTLGPKDRARVARASSKDREEVRYCLIQKKKGEKKGTIIGAGAGAGISLLAGGGLAETALAAGGGALAGNAIGKGSGTNRRCDTVLRRNP